VVQEGTGWFICVNRGSKEPAKLLQILDPAAGEGQDVGLAALGPGDSLVQRGSAEIVFRRAVPQRRAGVEAKHRVKAGQKLCDFELAAASARVAQDAEGGNRHDGAGADSVASAGRARALKEGGTRAQAEVLRGAADRVQGLTNALLAT
jgi:hypothetical protein